MSKKKYLKPLYDVIATKPMKLSTIAEKYIYHDKQFVQFFNSVGESIVNAGYAEKLSNNGLLGENLSFVPKAGCATAVIEKIRAELLENGSITDETFALCAIFDKCRFIKDYFSKAESAKLKLRLKEIRNSDAHKTTRKVLDSIEATIVTLFYTVP